MKGDKEIVGTLRGFDDYVNMVMDASSLVLSRTPVDLLDIFLEIFFEYDYIVVFFTSYRFERCRFVDWKISPISIIVSIPIPFPMPKTPRMFGNIPSPHRGRRLHIWSRTAGM